MFAVGGGEWPRSLVDHGWFKSRAVGVRWPRSSNSALIATIRDRVVGRSRVIRRAPRRVWWVGPASRK